MPNTSELMAITGFRSTRAVSFLVEQCVLPASQLDIPNVIRYTRSHPIPNPVCYVVNRRGVASNETPRRGQAQPHRR